MENSFKKILYIKDLFEDSCNEPIGAHLPPKSKEEQEEKARISCLLTMFGKRECLVVTKSDKK